MQRALGWLLAVGALLIGVNYGWTRYRTAAQSRRTENVQGTPTYAEQQEAQHVVEVRGPLADLFTKKKPSQEETVRSSSRARDASEHVADSPVGTGSTILHKTFGIAKTVDVPFEVPAHATSPHLHGAFHSYVQNGGTQSSDTDANVDFLLLNEQQHADLLSGRAGEAVFSTEDAHDQEVNFNMPATFSNPAKYFLVFRNSSRSEGRKVVQADFRIDF
jgi:hypothetical protein